jgi:hypothetical protein
VTASGIVWGVNNLGTYITKDLKGYWTQQAGSFHSIATAGNHVWAVSRTGSIYYRPQVIFRQGMQKRISGALKQISVTASGRVWGVNKKDYIFTRGGVNGKWKHIPGKLKQVAVSGDHVWGVDENDSIWWRQGVSGNRKGGSRWKRIPGKLKQISVSASGRVWGFNRNDHIFTRKGLNGKGNWKRIPGSAKWTAAL